MASHKFNLHDHYHLLVKQIFKIQGLLEMLKISKNFRAELIRKQLKKKKEIKLSRIIRIRIKVLHKR